MNNADLTSIRAHLPKLATFADRLVRHAPPALRPNAQLLANLLHYDLKMASEAGFDPPNDRLPQTPRSGKAAAEVSSWAGAHCRTPIDASANKARALVMCVAAGAGPDVVQQIIGRTSVPSATGKGQDLLDGIRGAAAGEDAIVVNLDPFVTPEQEAHIKTVVGAPPVVAIREHADNGTLESPSREDCS